MGETQEHTIRDCRCWERERAPLTNLISDEQWAQLPPHTRHCGLFDEDPALLDLQAELARDPMPQPIPRPPPPGECPDTYTTYTDPLTGWTWTYAATDGACTNQAIPLLARAGFGVYYGIAHRLNHSARVHGLTQNAQIAETLAIVHLTACAERPVHVFVDNKAVVDGFQSILDGNPPPQGTHADLWAKIYRSVQAKPDMFRVEKVASHLGDVGIDLGLISPIAEEFNRQADALATAAARLHNLPPHVVTAAKTRHRQAAVLHSVAVAIYERRHRTLPLPSRRAGYTNAELSKMEPNPLLSDPAPSTPGPAVPQDPEDLWDEAQRQALDEPAEDPFGFGGGLDFLDDQPEGPPANAPPTTAHHPVT